ncbi:pterocarpan synthase 1-like [Gastrolobium bilobum]|uniref:pterocarpan synthase 1-like n=1 Tax=Gastrolobium bilobum TaxID=150636 RepID=UPI002AB081B0|nr:pterocarpan synthase 1-like [Gastrolobium bilobum]
MAASFSTPIKFLFFSLLVITIMVSQANCEVTQRRLEQTNMVFFIHEVARGPNATVAPVTGINGKVWSYNTFGTIFVVDDPVTLSASSNSNPIGRVQGLITASSLDGANVNVVLSIVFNNFQYNGSTLEIQGTSRQRENYREVSVVSGTGKFRFARGFAALETLSYDAATTHSVIRLSVTLFQT